MALPQRERYPERSEEQGMQQQCRGPGRSLWAEEDDAAMKKKRRMMRKWEAYIDSP